MSKIFIMLDGDKCYGDKPISKGAGAGGGHVLINRPLGEGLVEKGRLGKDLKAPGTWWGRHFSRGNISAKTWQGMCLVQKEAVT